MSKLQKKWIADDAIDGSKVKLNNDEYLRARNAGDSADINIIKVDTSDELQLALKLKDESTAAPTVDAHLANKKYVDDQVAGITIPSVFELQGNWDGSSNTPTLANTDTGVANYLYYVNVAGSVDFGAGSITFAKGDWVYNVNGAWEKADNNDDVLSVAGKTGAVVLDTDDVSEASNLYWTQARFDVAFAAEDTDSLTEGATNKYYSSTLFNADFSSKSTTDLSEGTNLYYTQARFDSAFTAKDSDDLSEGSVNLYHTDARAKAAAVVNSTAGSETDQAASVAAMKSYVAGEISASTANFGHESITLVAGDITNGYVELAQEAVANSVQVVPKGGPVQELSVDFTLSVPASVTRVTFAGDLAAELAAGDKLMIQYSY